CLSRSGGTLYRVRGRLTAMPRASSAKARSSASMQSRKVSTLRTSSSLIKSMLPPARTQRVVSGSARPFQCLLSPPVYPHRAKSTDQRGILESVHLVKRDEDRKR